MYSHFCNIDFRKNYAKHELAEIVFQQMINRMQSIFKYEGLPETIPQDIFELMLQTRGVLAVVNLDRSDFISEVNHNSGLYALFGGYGGRRDIYYRPTQFIAENPVLIKSLNLTPGIDCVIFKNDVLMQGIVPICRKYSELIAENEISLRIALITSRAKAIISSNDDATYESAKIFLSKLIEGDIGIIQEDGLTDSLKISPYASSSSINSLKEYIEIEQYLIGRWFNDLGLNSLFNMKRESIGASESGLNEDALKPFVDEMLYQRQESCKKMNEMYGTTVKCMLNSSWAINEAESKIELSELKDIDNEVSDES